MQRNYEATLGEWTNFTKTTAEVSQQAFIKAMDKAYNLTASGTVSYTQSVKEAINDVASNGVEVVYPSGHKDTIETAMLRAVRTGISQMSAQITDARMEEMGWDIILVSSHLGARVTDKEDYTNHSWWPRKVLFQIRKRQEISAFSVCGMGDVQGIHGANAAIPTGRETERIIPLNSTTARKTARFMKFNSARGRLNAVSARQNVRLWD